MAKVFISYDREDSDFAELVQARLTKAGHVTFMDFEILEAGDDWRDRLEQVMRESHAVVVIMTPEASASAYVTYEWSFALGAGVRVIPLEHKSAVFHPRLEVLQRLDFTSKSARPWDALLLEVEKAAERQPDTTIPMPPGVPPVIKRAVAALDSTEPAEQKAAILLLGQADHPAAREVLIGALQHPVKDVRIAAAFAFPDKTDPRILRGLLDAVRDLGVWKYWSDGCAFSMRASWIGAPAVPQLVQALGDQDCEVRLNVAVALGEIGEAAATGGLIGALAGDEDKDVRACAAEALGKIADTTALDGLRAALTDESDEVREKAALALSNLRDSAAVTKLLQLLQDDKIKVRAACAMALGNIGDSAAVPALLRTLQDPAEPGEVREAAARSLGLLGAQDACEALRTELSSEQNPLRYAAAEALVLLRDLPSFALIAKVVGKFRGGTPPISVIEALGAVGEPAMPALLSILNEAPHSSLQETAAKGLKHIGTTAALTAVKQWERSH